MNSDNSGQDRACNEVGVSPTSASSPVEPPARGSTASSTASTAIDQVGIYWKKDSLDLVRSAYVADLADDPECPGSFVGWLERAAELHARRTPKDRARIAQEVSAPQGGPGLSRMFLIRLDILDKVEAAMVEDLEQVGRADSRSSFVRDAALIAAMQARQRRGGILPPAPHRLPKRPLRRRDLFDR